jgi:hypothetical protein
VPAPRSKPFVLPRARRADPEGDLQRKIVGLLRLAGVDFCHVPNSTGRAGARGQGKLVSLGVERGIPDLLIFDAPPNAGPSRSIKTDPYRHALGLDEAPGLTHWWPSAGACLELKATDRAKPVWPWDDKRATEEQRAFLRRRAESGLWAVAVAGPNEAEFWLKMWGYIA